MENTQYHPLQIIAHWAGQTSRVSASTRSVLSEDINSDDEGEDGSGSGYEGEDEDEDEDELERPVESSGEEDESDDDNDSEDINQTVTSRPISPLPPPRSLFAIILSGIRTPVEQEWLEQFLIARSSSQPTRGLLPLLPPPAPAASAAPATPPKKAFRPCFGASCPVGCTLDRHEAIERELKQKQRPKIARQNVCR